MSNPNDEDSNTYDSLNSTTARSSMDTLFQKNASMREMHEIEATKIYDNFTSDERSQYFSNEQEEQVNNRCDQTDQDSDGYFFLDIESEREIPLNDDSIQNELHASSQGKAGSLNGNKDSMYRCNSMTQLKSSLDNEASPVEDYTFDHSTERITNFLGNHGSIRRVKSQSILKSSPAYDDVPREQMRRTASFGTLEIREYPITLGDNPGGTQGPPVSLSWKYDKQRTKVIPLETYEGMRSPRRDRREMHMAEKMRRWRLLRECNYSMSELDKASKIAESVRRQRRKSLKANSPVSTMKKKVGKLFDKTADKDKHNLRIC